MKLPGRPMLRHCFLVLASWVALQGCATPPPEPSLFDRLGGLPAITAVVDRTIDSGASDPRTRRSFQGIKLSALKEGIVTHLCQITGGPCKYEGQSMAKVHEGLDITSTEFDALSEKMVASLNYFNVAEREKNDLQQLLAPMKRDVVTK